MLNLQIHFKELKFIVNQVINIIKQDSTIDPDNKVFIIHVPSGEVNLVPVFFKTKSVQACLPMKINQGTNPGEPTDLMFSTGDMDKILSSFPTVGVFAPDLLNITHQEDSSNINISIFQPSGKENVSPTSHIFTLPYLPPQRYIIEEFMALLENDSSEYKPLDLSQYTKPLEAYSDSYKSVSKHVTQKTYLHFNTRYLYMRTLAGMLAWHNPISEFADFNLVEDGVRFMYLLSHTLPKVMYFNDKQNTKLFFRDSKSSSIFIVNYRTKYNEDALLSDLFHLTSNSQTITMDCQMFLTNLKRNMSYSDLDFFVKPQGSGFVLASMNEHTMQSQYLSSVKGDLPHQIGFTVDPKVLISALYAITAKTDTLNIHFGVSDGVLTIGFTDETKIWYSLLSVQSIETDKLDTMREKYDKMLF